MRLFRLHYLFFIIIIVFLSLLFLGAIIIKKDWETFHIQYGSNYHPYKWVNYYIDLNIQKIYHNIFNQIDSDLPKVRVILPEKSLVAINSNLPDSGKIWQPAFLIDEKNKLSKIEMRTKGDNPLNWAFEKKTWRIKINKKNYSGGLRTIDYVIPDVLSFNRYFVNYLSKAFDLVTPSLRIVELEFNGVNQGVYYEIEKLDEDFLRRNNFMPVNLYKGSQFRREKYVAMDTNIFNNASLWSKTATFNKLNYHNKEDLSFFLNQIRKFETNQISPDDFFYSFPIDYWSKFMGTGHHIHSNSKINHRVICDPWSGWIIPLINDPKMYDFTQVSEIANDELDRIFNLDPKFVLFKYKNYFNYILKKNVLLNLADDFNKLKKPLITALKKDYNLTQNYYYQFLDSNYRTPNYFKNIIENYVVLLKKLSSDQINFFQRKIKTNWNYSNQKLRIKIDDQLPIGKIKIDLKNKINNKNLKISIHNKNKFYKFQSIPYELNNKSITLDAILVADRIPIQNAKIKNNKSKLIKNFDYFENVHEQSFMSTSIRPTTFTINFSENLEINKVHIQNIFNNKFYISEYSNENAFNPTSHNYAIIKKHNEEEIILSGKLQFNKTKIFNKKVIIKPGTIIYLKNSVNLIFKNKLIAEGTKDAPIKILYSNSENDIEKNYWGVFALIGPDTALSSLKFFELDGGSGGKYNNIFFSGMLSIHNTSNIKLDNIIAKNNFEFDDMIHLVYVNDSIISDSLLLNAKSDGLDIDISNNITIDNLIVKNSNNDCIDFMTSKGIIKKSTLNNCNDKGISIGEKSEINVIDTSIHNSTIAIQSKDRSIAKIYNSQILNNKIPFSAIKKNWRYGGGGKILVENSNINNFSKLKEIDQFSEIVIN